MTIGKNIRRINQERTLTQKQLDELFGASDAYIHTNKSDSRDPRT